MPSRSRVQPINGRGVPVEPTYPEGVNQLPKNRLMRFLERPFSLKNQSGGGSSSRGNSDEFEPDSVCLENMVQNNMQNETQPKFEIRNYFRCFIGGGTDSDEEEEEDKTNGDLQKIKNLVRNANISEENVTSEVKGIGEESDPRLKTLVDELVALGYDAAICKSSWEYSRRTLCPAGEYEYLDVMLGGERVLIDIDFKSKFEIVRPTETFKAVSQKLPYIFVGQLDKLKKLVIVVSRAARESFRTSGLHVPPWRKPKYMLTKWVAPHVRRKGGA